MILRINTRVGRFLLLMLVAFPLMAQSRRLNPTVKVLPKAVSAVPSECEEGLAPRPTQRVQAEETQPARDTTRDMEAPPRSDLRSQLVAVQRAAENNDRATFAALSSSAPPAVWKSSLRTSPLSWPCWPKRTPDSRYRKLFGTRSHPSSRLSVSSRTSCVRMSRTSSRSSGHRWSPPARPRREPRLSARA